MTRVIELMDKKFWQLQKAAGLSNKECAEWLKVTTRSIVKWRKGEPEAPHAVIIALQYRIKYEVI